MPPASDALRPLSSSGRERTPPPSASNGLEAAQCTLRVQPVRLDGWAERHGLSPLLLAGLVFVVAWLLFQTVAGIVAGLGIAIDLVKSGADFDAAGGADSLTGLMEQYPHLVLLGNTAGQVVGIGGMAWLATRLSTRSDGARFLRLHRPAAKGIGLAALGWVVALPLLLWIAEANARVPLPEWAEALERTQTDFLDGLLLGGEVSVGFLLVALAVTPALFEELLFRGYLQRQVERRWGTLASIVLVGLCFGAYHVRLSQLLPLAVLGMYLGFAVWATGNLWAGSLVHLLHNGATVLVTHALRQPSSLAEGLDEWHVPTWLLLTSGVLAAAAVWALYRYRDVERMKLPDTGAPER